MHLTLQAPPSARLNGKSPHATTEINAYIAIRDNLLAEAEDKPTSAKLNSAAIANEFVENCLRTSRALYRAQFLPKADAFREQQRCETVKKRIAALMHA